MQPISGIVFPTPILLSLRVPSWWDIRTAVYPCTQKETSDLWFFSQCPQPVISAPDYSVFSFKDYFHSSLHPLCGCHVCSVAYTGQKSAYNLLKFTKRVLGTTLRFSGREASALNHWAILTTLWVALEPSPASLSYPCLGSGSHNFSACHSSSLLTLFLSPVWTCPVHSSATIYRTLTVWREVFWG